MDKSQRLEMGGVCLTFTNAYRIGFGTRLALAKPGSSSEPMMASESGRPRPMLPDLSRFGDNGPDVLEFR